MQTEIKHEHRRIVEPNTTSGTCNTTQPRVSYPRLHMGQPVIRDKTGLMRFRFAIRMIAETNVVFRMLPDYLATRHYAFSLRQTLPLPRVELGTGNNGLPTILCLPYQLHNTS